ncbi:MAG: UDP-2,3-diacylglucosamine hydrolase [Flavobacteriales bacterium]|nr:UDP-2,3-diacylglucosamine hydrolase [Flavobacteriales bacterium]|tara:strand:- start:1166 stop:1903 length:738 start_codon:yes stop_codon:yes gene_type:complete
MKNRTKIYFASDFHLGSPNYNESLKREKKICRWLTQISHDAKEIYLVGDLFDFWFEYDKVIPKGFERIKGKLAELSDMGIKIIFFNGNHDLWTFGYFEKELGFRVYSKPQIIEINNKIFYIAHGDGLGKGNFTYKIIKKIYLNTFCQFLFAITPSYIGISLAKYLSNSSRKKNLNHPKKNIHEPLIEFSKKTLNNKKIDYFIFGHLHDPKIVELNKTSKYVNLGDCVKHFSYAELDGENLLLKNF